MVNIFFSLTSSSKMSRSNEYAMHMAFFNKFVIYPHQGRRQKNFQEGRGIRKKHQKIAKKTEK